MNQNFIIQYDLRVISILAIQRSIHDAKISKACSIDFLSPNQAQVSINNIDINEEMDVFLQKFNELVYDNQIRLDTEKEFRQIRNIIFAQAFFPCDNLDEILDAFLK